MCTSAASSLQTFVRCLMPKDAATKALHSLHSRPHGSARPRLLVSVIGTRGDPKKQSHLSATATRMPAGELGSRSPALRGRAASKMASATAGSWPCTNKDVADVKNEVWGHACTQPVMH